MNTKLTLSIEQSVIKRAKNYAKQSGRSLSDLVQSYLEKLIAEKMEETENVPKDFQDLFGCLTLPTEMDDKTTIREILIKKHR